MRLLYLAVLLAQLNMNLIVSIIFIMAQQVNIN